MYDLMYDPMYTIVHERHEQALQSVIEHRRLKQLNDEKYSLRNRLLISVSGVLIALGTRMKDAAVNPCQETPSLTRVQT